jgi:hypothetical protein
VSVCVCVCVCVTPSKQSVTIHCNLNPECFLSRHGVSHGYINIMVLRGRNDAQFGSHMPTGITSAVKKLHTRRQLHCNKQTYIPCGKNEVLFQVKTGATHVLVTFLTMSHYTLTNRKANNERYGTDTQVCGCALLTVPTRNPPRMGRLQKKNGSARTNYLPTKTGARELPSMKLECYASDAFNTATTVLLINLACENLVLFIPCIFLLSIL